MPKKLIIIRHAKSDWGNSTLRDFDRPLNKRGKLNAPEMADRLVQQQLIPQKIVSSSALRAITTAQYFAHAWKIPVASIEQEPSIYEASVRSLLKVINNFDHQLDQIAVFGHNPGLSDLVNYLGGHISDLPTCAVVVLEFPFEDWGMVSADTGRVVHFDYPKSGDD